MKAAVLSKYDAPLVIQDVDIPAIGPTEVLIRVRASTRRHWAEVIKTDSSGVSFFFLLFELKSLCGLGDHAQRVTNKFLIFCLLFYFRFLAKLLQIFIFKKEEEDYGELGADQHKSF